MYKKIKNSSLMNLFWFILVLLPLLLFIIFSINFSSYSQDGSITNEVTISDSGSSYTGLSDYNYISLNTLGGMSYKVLDSNTNEYIIQNSNITSINVSGIGQTDIIKSIPNEIQSLNGYGFGINDNCYNYIDFENKKFIQKVGRIDLGSVDFVISARGYFNGFVSDLKYVSSLSVPNLLCAFYNVTTPDVMYNQVYDMTISTASGGPQVWIRNSNFNTVQSFISAMSGVYLYYELSTPIVTDISEYLLDFNPIILNNNYDTITFVSDYASSIPYEFILFNNIHGSYFNDFLSQFLSSFSDYGFLSKILILFMNYFGVSNIYFSLLSYYLEYFIVLQLIHLSVDLLLLLPNICHKFLEKVGGERD